MVARAKPKKKASAAVHVKTRGGTVRNPETGFGGPRGTSFKGNWLKLAEAVGGVNALAQLLGISYPTLYRWAVKRGKIPGIARQVLGMVAGQRGLPNPAVDPG